MALTVAVTGSPQEALEGARGFLEARPVDHNLVLTILDQSAEYAVDGRYWTVAQDDEALGFGLQSPQAMPLVISPMPVEACRALAEAIVVPLPGVHGEAASAAAFAGQWTERHGIPVAAIDGGRLYELKELVSVASAPGHLRPARDAERAQLVEWTAAFGDETGDRARHNPGQLVDWALSKDLLWVWHDQGIRSMARSTLPRAGVTRIGVVYTPPESRGRGYAAACVEALSHLLIGRGERCILYTQLQNPTSNAIYRRIGYRATAEILAFAFAEAPC